MMRGLPASGKTSLALEEVKRGQGKVKRINKDELRAMIDGGKFSRDREAMIEETRNMLTRHYLSQGKTVIIDDTNFHPSHEAALRQIAEECAVPFRIVDLSDVPLGVCLERNRIRERQVPEKWIFEQWEKYVKPVQDEASQPYPAIICDLDGTLALLNGRNPYDASTCESDTPNELVKEIWTSFNHQDHMKILVSGRSSEHRAQTERWLDKNWIHYHALYMRDVGDSRPDEVVKREIYDNHIRGMWHVKAVIDDRPKVIRMWQYDLGLPVINVGYGIEF
jgi:predicted kinase